jgi:hypothetical protein
MTNAHLTRTLSPADRLGVSGETLIVYPWLDPVIDASGHPVRSEYVEQFWLGILGPTATWLLRRLVSGFDHYPDGYELNLPDTAAALGLTFRTDKECPFLRAMERLTLFGVAQSYSYGLAVRTRVPQLGTRNLQKLPQHLRDAHELWVR